MKLGNLLENDRLMSRFTIPEVLTIWKASEHLEQLWNVKQLDGKLIDLTLQCQDVGNEHDLLELFNLYEEKGML